MALILVLLLTVYLVFLYDLQIVQGEEYYNRSNELSDEVRTVTATRGNIFDRYGRLMVGNTECYNLKIDTDKLFANEDPNAVILELVEMVESFGDSYTDDLPITMEPPFEYIDDMTEIQRTMLDAYFTDKTRVKEFDEMGIPSNPSAVELMSYMRTRYDIDNSYTAEEMRIIAGVRYSLRFCGRRWHEAHLLHYGAKTGGHRRGAGLRT